MGESTMSLKDNFNQALKELLKKDGLVGEELSKDSKKKTELDRYLDRPSEPVPAPPPITESVAKEPLFNEKDTVPEQPQSAVPEKTETPKIGGYSLEALGIGAYSGDVEAEGFPEHKSATTPPPSQASFQSAQFAQGLRRESAAPPPPPPPINRTPSSASFGGKTPEPSYYETEETTVISRNTIIDGNIRSFANITIDGSVKGDVKITKNINITGKVVGDIECNNSTMIGASMQGNILSKGQVQVDRDSLLLGDISAQYLDLNGKIKGNIDVGGKAEFKTDAVILGNITASTITVLDGATIQGYVNTTFLQENSANIFPDTIAVSE
jgi:cytoskeletal protein CcmA (bactofilin family)